MKSKSADMQEIFNKLSEKNKELIILIARSMKVAQESEGSPRDTVPRAV